MKHSLKNSKNLLSRVSAHKRKIAFLLAAAIIIPYFSQIFMKWQERKEFLKQQEASQQEDATRDEDAAMARFSQYVDQSDYENALGEIDLLLSVDQSNPQYYLKRAGLYVLLDRSNDALLDLDTALVLSPDLYDALQLRAQIYGENARYKEAAADYERMYKLDPEQKMFSCTALTATSRWETMRKPSPPTIQQQKPCRNTLMPSPMPEVSAFTPQRTMKRLLQTCCNICLLPLKMES